MNIHDRLLLNPSAWRREGKKSKLPLLKARFSPATSHEDLPCKTLDNLATKNEKGDLKARESKQKRRINYFYASWRIPTRTKQARQTNESERAMKNKFIRRAIQLKIFSNLIFISLRIIMANVTIYLQGRSKGRVAKKERFSFKREPGQPPKLLLSADDELWTSVGINLLPLCVSSCRRRRLFPPADKAVLNGK